MNAMIKIIIAICVILSTVSLSIAQGWRGIEPLHSTRADVERLIGRPTESNGITYHLKDEVVNIVYSTGNCAKGADWRAQPGTVLGITIYPQKKLRLGELGLDLKKFEKFINPMGDRVAYTNKNEGFTVEVDLNDEIISTQYFPASKDEYLRCPVDKTRVLTNEDLRVYLFDELSKLSLVDEQARLSNFASRLQNQSAVVGYIVGFTSPRGRASEVKTRLNRAKDYLITQHRILASRLITRYGGHSPKSIIRLYVVPKEAQSR
jgi:hypothetical protein